MFNKLSETKFFNLGNTKFDYTTGLGKINFKDYYIPAEFYEDKVKGFKGFKYPLANEIMNAVLDRKVILVDLSKANNSNCKIQDMRVTTKWPSAIFNMEIVDENGEIVTIVDLSSKGSYAINNATKEPYHYNIDQTNLFAMCTAGYFAYKLACKPELSNNVDLFTTIGEAYALIMDKVFSPMLSTNSVIDTSKIHLLSFVFCLQSMFGVDKTTAIKHGLKSKFVIDKHGTEDSCLYCQTTADIMDNCDYKTVFPIDNFCTQITQEFEYITSAVCNPGKLAKQFDDWFNRNALFTLEHSKSFITMLVFSKYGIDIFNNFRLKNFLAMASGDIVKDLAQIIK